jgi:hypothetical protein
MRLAVCAALAEVCMTISLFKNDFFCILNFNNDDQDFPEEKV